MDTIRKLKDMGFIITWKLIEIGLFGRDEIPVLLWKEDVLEYLDYLLSDINDQNDVAIELICNKEEPERFNNIIKRLAANEKSDVMIQKRKWRAYMVKSLIDNNSDFPEGLLDLMEFWIIKMHAPEDSPLSFLDNRKDVQDYYCQSLYDICVEKNRIWLKKEISTIIDMECNY